MADTPAEIEAFKHGLEHFKTAIGLLKGQKALADAVGVKQPSVHHILNDGKKVPAEWCLKIELATHGAVTRHQLRPDLYPAEEAAE